PASGDEQAAWMTPAADAGSFQSLTSRGTISLIPSAASDHVTSPMRGVPGKEACPPEGSPLRIPAMLMFAFLRSNRAPAKTESWCDPFRLIVHSADTNRTGAPGLE